MKPCANCQSISWPFFIVLLVAGMSAFVTALTMDYAEVAFEVRVGFTAAVFVGVGAFMSMYVLRCMRRHCGHQKT